AIPKDSDPIGLKIHPNGVEAGADRGHARLLHVRVRDSIVRKRISGLEFVEHQQIGVGTRIWVFRIHPQAIMCPAIRIISAAQSATECSSRKFYSGLNRKV